MRVVGIVIAQQQVERRASGPDQQTRKAESVAQLLLQCEASQVTAEASTCRPHLFQSITLFILVERRFNVVPYSSLLADARATGMPLPVIVVVIVGGLFEEGFPGRVRFWAGHSRGPQGSHHHPPRWPITAQAGFPCGDFPDMGSRATSFPAKGDLHSDPCSLLLTRPLRSRPIC
jgi:hypothetical protein